MKGKACSSPRSGKDVLFELSLVSVDFSIDISKEFSHYHQHLIGPIELEKSQKIKKMNLERKIENYN